jgi:peptidoglycan/LPS O-acetylase OafA/YrhL
VLSGFLITTLLLERRVTESHSIRTFYLRRMLRLIPALLALLLVNLLYAVVYGGVANALRSYVVVLGYFTNWAILLGISISPYLTHLWTLAIEEQFYIVWPVLMFATLRCWPSRRKLALLTLSIAILAAAWRAVLYLHGESWLLIYFRTDTRADALAIGALMALIPRERLASVVNSCAPTVAGPIALAILVGAANTVRISSEILYVGGFTIVAIVAAVLIATALESDSPLSKLLSTRPFVTLGRLSYSIYLWHFGVFTVVAAHTVTWDAVPRVALAWAVTLVISSASYRFVEQPPLALKRRLGQRPAAKTSASEADRTRAVPPISAAVATADAARPADGRPGETGAR